MQRTLLPVASLTSLLASLAPSAQVVQLNGPLAQPGRGAVTDAALSPDGSRVVYRADVTTDEVFDLYSATPTGADSRKLNPDLAAWQDVGSFALAPLGGLVVFTGAVERILLAAPIDGSVPAVALTPLYGSDRRIADFLVSPDGATVVFVADADDNETYELFSVPSDGSAAPIQLSPALVPGGDVFTQTVLAKKPLAFTPDGARVLFLADALIDDVAELFSVPANGGAPAERLNLPFVAGQKVIDFEISADSRTCVYRADQDTPTQFELFAAAVDGNAGSVRVHRPLVTGGDVGALDSCIYTCTEIFLKDQYKITADGARVVFVADWRASGQFELLSAPLEGLHPKAKRAGARMLVLADDFGLFEQSIRFGPDGHVVFLHAGGLWTSPVDRIERLRLDHGPDGQVGHFWIDPRSPRVLYAAADGSTYGLYVVPLDRHFEPRLVAYDPSLYFSEDDVVFVPNSAKILFRKYDLGQHLYSVRLDGALLTDLSGPMQAHAHLNGLLVDPNGTFVVYRGNARVNDVEELYSAPIDGSADPLVVNQPLAGGGFVRGSVREFKLRSDGQLAVYLADEETDEIFELFSVALQAPFGRTKLHADLPPGRNVLANGFELSPDGTRAAFIADIDANDVYELYVVPSDGSAAPVKLSGVLVAGGDVTPGLRFSPDSSRLLFRADAAEDERFELFGVPSDGSAPAVKLNHVLVSGGDVLSLSADWNTLEVGYQFSPDGARVVYRADQGVDGAVVPELYSVPAEGGTAVKLNGTLRANRDPVAKDYQITPDSRFVLYRASQTTDGFTQLWRAPIDGSSAAIEMNGSLAGGTSHSVDSFLVTPDGTRVLYVADVAITGDSQHEKLWSVPVDRSAAPVELSGPMVPGGGVAPNFIPVSLGEAADFYRNGYRATSDGWCVYKADARSAGIHDLYRVPIDGSAPPELLSGDLRVQAFGTTADDAHGIFYGFTPTNEFRLYRVDLAAPAGPSPLTPSLDYFGTFRLSRDGKRVTYFADEVDDGFRVHGLLSVPCDGSTGSTLLSGSVLFSSSAAFDATADAARVVFLPDPSSSSFGKNLYLANP